MTRYRVRFVFIPVGAIVFLTVFLVRACWGPANVTGDYRDPSVLARAISAAAQKAGDGTPDCSSCAQVVFPGYVCTVGLYGGTVATYQATVATDGSSWHASQPIRRRSSRPTSRDAMRCRGSAKPPGRQSAARAPA